MIILNTKMLVFVLYVVTVGSVCEAGAAGWSVTNALHRSCFYAALFNLRAGEEPVLHGESAGEAEAAAEQSAGADVQLAREARQPGALSW